MALWFFSWQGNCNSAVLQMPFDHELYLLHSHTHYYSVALWTALLIYWYLRIYAQLKMAGNSCMNILGDCSSRCPIAFINCLILTFSCCCWLDASIRWGLGHYVCVFKTASAGKMHPRPFSFLGSWTFGGSWSCCKSCSEKFCGPKLNDLCLYFCWANYWHQRTSLSLNWRTIYWYC